MAGLKTVIKCLSKIAAEKYFSFLFDSQPPVGNGGILDQENLALGPTGGESLPLLSLSDEERIYIYD